jgi:hypothetical protein
MAKKVFGWLDVTLGRRFKPFESLSNVKDPGSSRAPHLLCWSGDLMERLMAHAAGSCAARDLP